MCINSKILETPVTFYSDEQSYLEKYTMAVYTAHLQIEASTLVLTWHGASDTRVHGPNLIQDKLKIAVIHVAPTLLCTVLAS